MYCTFILLQQVRIILTSIHTYMLWILYVGKTSSLYHSYWRVYGQKSILWIANYSRLVKICLRHIPHISISNDKVTAVNVFNWEHHISTYGCLNSFIVRQIFFYLHDSCSELELEICHKHILSHLKFAYAWRWSCWIANCYLPLIVDL